MTETTRIHIKGARVHNLDNLELTLQRGELIVFTGVSGSGKSSLAFDTIYAEGYRKFMESLSVRARAAMEQVARPDVDFIHGLSPVIAIEQRTAADGNPRSTVATITEVADYGRLLWCVLGTQLDPVDGSPVVRRSLDDCVASVLALPEGSRAILLAPALCGRASVLREELPRIRQRGFSRVRIGGIICELNDESSIPYPKAREEGSVDIVIDRIVIRADQRSRIADSLELGFKEGFDRVEIQWQATRDAPWKILRLSQKLCGQTSGIVYEPLTPKSFSWNSPDGACPTCNGLGETLQFQPALVIPDPSVSIKAGAIKPWRLGSKQMITRRNSILRQIASLLEFDLTTPWSDLPEETRQLLLHGSGDRLFPLKLKGGNSKPEQVPFEGVLNELTDTYRTTRSDSLRARLTAFQTTSPCNECAGTRLNERARNVFINGIRFTDFLAMPVSEALSFIRKLKRPSLPVA